MVAPVSRTWFSYLVPFVVECCVVSRTWHEKELITTNSHRGLVHDARSIDNHLSEIVEMIDRMSKKISSMD